MDWLVQLTIPQILTLAGVLFVGLTLAAYTGLRVSFKPFRVEFKKNVKAGENTEAVKRLCDDVAGLKVDVSALKEENRCQNLDILKGIIWNDKIGIPTRLAAYVRYENMGGNHETKYMAERELVPGNEAVYEVLKKEIRGK
jgi:hypothetical protein